MMMHSKTLAFDGWTDEAIEYTALFICITLIYGSRLQGYAGSKTESSRILQLLTEGSD